MDKPTEAMMICKVDRLTNRNPQGIAYLAKVKDNEQEIEASKNTCECLYESWQRLADLEDAEEQGLLVVLPCKSGDTIYATNTYSNQIIECSVDYIVLEDEIVLQISYDYNEVCYECEGCPFSSWSQNLPDCDYSCAGESGMFTIKASDFGKQFYANHTEAEAALSSQEVSENE